MIVALLVLSFVAGSIVGICRIGTAQKSHQMPSWLPKPISKAIKLFATPSCENHSSEPHLSDPCQYGDDYFLTKDQVEARFDPCSWQRLAYDDFKTKLLAKDTNLKTFPCIYAIMGFRANEHRYLFLHSCNPSEPQNIRLIAPALQSYLLLAPSLGPNTSLVIFAGPSPIPTTLQTHHANFWNTLRGLRIADPIPWPVSIPSSTPSSRRTFCFANEPVFPILMTPSHGRRFSRHMSVPVLAIQPKWALDALLDTAQHRDAATRKARKLLEEYDAVDVSPDLTGYGDPGSSESRQLCLADENDSGSVECPYEDLDR